MAQVHIPSQAQLIAPQVECDCIDSTHGKVLSGTTAWEAYVALTSETPKIFALALRARNAVARLLKAEAISGFAEKNPDRAPKADVECVLMSPAKPQPAKEYDDGDEKCRADECKCADFCLCAHAPLSFL